MFSLGWTMPSLYTEDSVLDLPEPAQAAAPESVAEQMPTTQATPNVPAEAAPSAQPSMSDQEWTARLVGLLTHLDYYRSLMETHHLIEDVAQLVEKAEVLVQITEDVARKVTFNKSQSDKVAAAIAKAGAFFTAGSSLRRQPGKGLINNMLSALAPTPEPFSPELIRDYLFSGADTLNSYFSLFTERFSNTTASRRWVDAATAFLSELKNTIRQLPES